jgi:hypothetical protein
LMSAAEPCRSKAPYASGLVLVNACRRVVEEPNVPLLKSPKRSTMVSKMVMKLGRLLVCEDQKSQVPGPDDGEALEDGP